MKNISSKCRILTYQYDASQLFRARQSRQSIRQMALKLLQALKTRRRNAQHVCDPEVLLGLKMLIGLRNGGSSLFVTTLEAS